MRIFASTDLFRSFGLSAQNAFQAFAIRAWVSADVFPLDESAQNFDALLRWNISGGPRRNPDLKLGLEEAVLGRSDVGFQLVARKP